MTTDPRRRELYYNIAALPESKGLSPEEIRIEDYIKAYSTTGRPPAPVPQEPTGDSARTALGLLPLFQPFVEYVSGTDSLTLTTSTSPATTVTDPTQLPKIHQFQPLTLKDGDTYQSISMMPEFQFFSLEELRCYAYAAGVKFPPTPLPTDLPPITMQPTSSTPTSKSPPLIIHPFYTKDTPETAFFKEINPLAQGQILYYYSISADWRFKSHSPEELRIAYLQAGRELNSAEINPGLAATTAPSSPTTSSSTSSGASTIRAGPTTGGAFSRSPVIRPF